MTPKGSLRQRTLIALIWSGIGEYGASALRLLALLALSWLLPPRDFGLLALAMIFIVIAEGVGELGLGAALVRRKTVRAIHLDSVFWPVLVLNLVLALVTLSIAPRLASLLGDSDAAGLIRLLALALPINALALLPRSVLLRELRFREVSTAHLLGEVGYATVGVGMALDGWGVWSLGGAVLARRLLILVRLWSAARCRPGRSFEATAFRDLAAFGYFFAAGSVIDRMILNIDFLVVGKWLGTEMLGYYSLAFQLTMLPIGRLVELSNRVFLPAFSRVQDELHRLGKALLESLHHLLTLVIFLALSIATFGPVLLEALYGQKWNAAVQPLRILAIGGICISFRVAEPTLLALGRPALKLGLSALRLAVFLGLVAGCLRFGVSGVAVSMVAATLVAGLAAPVLASRLLGLSLGAWLEAIRPPVLAGAAALTPLIALLFVDTTGPMPRLLIGGAMVLVYLVLTLPRVRQLVGLFKPGQERWPGLPAS